MSRACGLYSHGGLALGRTVLQIPQMMMTLMLMTILWQQGRRAPANALSGEAQTHDRRVHMCCWMLTSDSCVLLACEHVMGVTFPGTASQVARLLSLPSSSCPANVRHASAVSVFLQRHGASLRRLDAQLSSQSCSGHVQEGARCAQLQISACLCSFATNHASLLQGG